MLEVFDDRVVVTSPGALPNHMTVEQAKSGGAPRSRNEMMANAMVVAGLMERSGRGWPTMRHAMRAFNDTDPASDQRQPPQRRPTTDRQAASDSHLDRRWEGIYVTPDI